MTTLTCGTIVSLRVPKTTLSFCNSLEGLTELTGSYYTRGHGLLQLKKTDENQPREELPAVLFPWSHRQCYFSGNNVWQQAPALPTREAHMSLGV